MKKSEIKTTIGVTLLLFCCSILPLSAQYSTLNAHSHNDYENVIPFWIAYYNHFGSIEADIWAIDNELYVAHSRADVKPERTLDDLYIQPVVKLLRYNGGRVWHDFPGVLQLLIDLKTVAEPTLSLLVEKLKQYPDVFDPSVNKNAVRVVISGNRPEPGLFVNYPGFIFFDGLLNLKYTEEQSKRVPLYSENLRKFTLWDGKSDIPASDLSRLKSVVDSVHALNKGIRFWNAPDNSEAWKTFIDLQVDYLNTDKINELAEYLKLPTKNSAR
jgi:alkaline phosphatase